MSEVKTIAILSVFGKETALIDLAHLDRVTAERNAALARLEEALVESLVNQNEREVVCANYEALQQRLTAVDERAGVLEGLLRELIDADSVLAQWTSNEVADNAENAYQNAFEKLKAALKPAEGGGDD